MKPERDIREAATELLERKFVPRAQAPGAAEQIDSELDDKISDVKHRRIKYRRQLLDVVAQAKALWARRGELDRKQVGLLAAALLYFVSPLDLIPDVVPGLGYVDDLFVLGYTLKTIVSAIGPMRDALIERATNTMTDKGRKVLEEVIDSRLAEFDRASAEAVRRSVAIVAISLWGMTTAAAISLAVVTLTGKYALEWTIYVATASILVGICNIATAVHYWREFRRLHGSTQTRLATLVATRLRMRDIAAVVVPIVLLLSLLLARFYVGAQAA